jgi:hypothetical protein
MESREEETEETEAPKWETLPRTTKDDLRREDLRGFFPVVQRTKWSGTLNCSPFCAHTFTFIFTHFQWVLFPTLTLS